MIKKHQQAFNKAFVACIKSKKRKLVLNEKTKAYDVVVPLAEVTKNFRKFIDVVEKDLKIGKHKPNKPAAAKKTGR